MVADCQAVGRCLIADWLAALSGRWPLAVATGSQWLPLSVRGGRLPDCRLVGRCQAVGRWRLLTGSQWLAAVGSRRSVADWFAMVAAVRPLAAVGCHFSGQFIGSNGLSNCGCIL